LPYAECGDCGVGCWNEVQPARCPDGEEWASFVAARLDNTLTPPRLSSSVASFSSSQHVDWLSNELRSRSRPSAMPQPYSRIGLPTSLSALRYKGIHFRCLHATLHTRAATPRDQMMTRSCAQYFTDRTVRVGLATSTRPLMRPDHGG
jgi:hypothetical protein